MIFKPGARTEADEWTHDGAKISDPEKLSAIEKVLRESGPVLIRHSFLRGGRAPHQVVFDEFDELVEYLTESARAGDNIMVWDLWPYMRDVKPLASGKCPDADGTVPKKGAY
jgi:hypothetical protein